MTTIQAAVVFVPILLASSCSTPTTRVVCKPEFRDRPDLEAPALQPPPPAPQVMIAAPIAAADPAQRTVTTITEAERTEMLRAAGSPIPPYTPAPFHAPSHAVEGDDASYDDSYVQYAGDHGYWGPVFGLARAAAYTGMGAIIGHQFHEKGAGAAIGAGLALLTTPWWGIGDCQSGWGY